jgi:hypothetical protein
MSHPYKTIDLIRSLYADECFLNISERPPVKCHHKLAMAQKVTVDMKFNVTFHHKWPWKAGLKYVYR